MTRLVLSFRIIVPYGRESFVGMHRLLLDYLKSWRGLLNKISRIKSSLIFQKVRTCDVHLIKQRIWLLKSQDLISYQPLASLKFRPGTDVTDAL